MHATPNGGGDALEAAGEEGSTGGGSRQGGVGYDADFVQEAHRVLDAGIGDLLGLKGSGPSRGGELSRGW